MSEKQDIEKRISERLNDDNAFDGQKMFELLRDSRAALTALRERVERLEGKLRHAEDCAVEWCQQYLDANGKNNLAVLAEWKLRRAALAPTTPAKETTCSSESGAGSSDMSVGTGTTTRSSIEYLTTEETSTSSTAMRPASASTAPADAAATPDPRGLVEAMEWIQTRARADAKWGTDPLTTQARMRIVYWCNRALAAYRKGASDGRA